MGKGRSSFEFLRQEKQEMLKNHGVSGKQNMLQKEEKAIMIDPLIAIYFRQLHDHSMHGTSY